MSRRLHQAAVTLIASVALVACQRNSLRIDGDIKNLPDGPITLARLDSTFHWQPVDTAQSRNGRFTFDGRVSLPQAECVVLSVANQNMVVFAGNDNVYMTGNALRPEDIEVTGSSLNDDLVNFANNVPGKERLAQIMAQLAVMGPDVDRREELNDEVVEIQKSQLDYIRRCIYDNATSPLGPFILFNNMSLFSFEEVETFLATFKRSMPTHPYIHFLEREINNRREQNEALKRVQLGCPAPDFPLTSNPDDTLRLSSLRGKIVLLDFWTPADIRSRKNNETIAAVNSKFSQMGLEVVGVAINTDSVGWRNAISSDKLPGHQLLDDGSISALYGISTVPTSFLIDKVGNIVSRDKTGNIFDDLGTQIRK